MFRNYHKGWWIRFVASNPRTGRYVALRYGIEMCAGSYSGLLDMIDHRND